MPYYSSRSGQGRHYTWGTNESASETGRVGDEGGWGVDRSLGGGGGEGGDCGHRGWRE